MLTGDKIKDIEISEYSYELPPDRIAQHPVEERDMSKLLVFRDKTITSDLFTNIGNYLQSGSLLVFNNTRVIRARILFRKHTGAEIEILCLEPVLPAEYELSFSSTEPVEWKCIVGNLKKWKKGNVETSFRHGGKEYVLTAKIVCASTDTFIIRFSWNSPELSFGEVIETAGHVPLPPYINREDTEDDSNRYQTVYSRIKGSVAAPTAGLHFTGNVFEKIKAQGIKTEEITLHVGAGTFQPVKSSKISGHEMHSEHFFVTASTIKSLIRYSGRIIPVGTTSVRTLESLYWLGIKAIKDPSVYSKGLSLGQWEPYILDSVTSVEESLGALVRLMNDNGLKSLQASTAMIIVPGYDFRIISGMVTNFHQPRSTLLLLISAWTGNKWKDIYSFALGNGFRFLSYGDSSLLLK
jgi:S-adenosylmethionine:tRNA ribosyltransferase-isomerase